MSESRDSHLPVMAAEPLPSRACDTLPTGSGPGLTVMVWNSSAQIAGTAAACSALEWVYYAGETTFLDSFTMSSRVGAGILTAGFLWLASSVALAPLVASSLVHRSLPRLLLPLIPALMVTGFGVLLGWRWIDPMASEGALGWSMFGWRAFVVVVFVLSYLRFRATIAHPTTRISRWVAPAVLLICVVWILGRSTTSGAVGLHGSYGPPPAKRPHIILLAADGIEARSMSAYGASVDTTPFMGRLVGDAVVYENAFVNASRTTASTSSMLTGRHPLETKVLYPPQIFEGRDSHTHLPLVLRAWGYSAFQASVRFYADSEDLNMVGAFDLANGRHPPSLPASPILRSLVVSVNDELYYIRRVSGQFARILRTLLTGEEEMSPFRTVSINKGIGKRADKRVLDQALEFLDEADGPVFMHIHLLGTHCCKFKPSQQHFTDEQARTVKGPVKNTSSRSKYLATVRDFDQNVEEFVQALEERGVLDDTLLIISSDHGVGWSVTERVPLIMRTPGGHHRGRVTQNVELLSVPATILEVLGVGTSALGWSMAPPLPMPGAVKDSAETVIIGVDDVSTTKSTDRERMGQFEIERPGPPTFGVRSLVFTSCDHWARWMVDDQRWVRGRVSEHTAPCGDDGVLQDQVLQGYLREVRARYGVDLVR